MFYCSKSCYIRNTIAMITQYYSVRSSKLNKTVTGKTTIVIYY